MYKRSLRMLSFLLTLVMLVNMLPVSAFAATADTGSETTSVTQNIPEEASVVAELPEKRTEYTKEFRLSNGLHMAAVYAEPVHYEKNGEWVDIDNTLKISGTGTDAVLTNTAGVWDVRFPQQLSDSKAVTITKDGYTLSFFMSGELRNSSGNIQVAAAETSELETYAIGGETFTVQKSNATSAQIQEIDLAGAKETAQFPEMVSEKNYSRLQYTGVYKNTNVIYDLASNRVKESIVINSYDAELQGYKYTLNVGSLIPMLTEDNQILLYDENKANVVMVMPAPYLMDADGEYCNDVSVALIGKGDTYILTYTLPQSWMADKARAYPVILDPVIAAAANYSNMEDASVYSKGSNYTYMRSLLDIGYKTNYGIMRAFTKYVDLPELTSSDIIISANFSLYKAVTSTDPKEVQLHKVKETWDSSTVKWSNQPDINTTIEDFGTIQAAGYYTYDITDIVRGWYEGENTGLAICVPQEIEETSTSNYVVQFYSSDSDIYNPDIKPILGITFRNNNGLESYWDYTASSAGRAGTGYVNNYTGNLTWIRNDIGFGGNRMPVSISHVYNANDSATNTFGMGYGWRTNFNQRVYQWTSDYAYGDYYVWEDSDGTAHYFLYSEADAAYLDEDGLELTLTTTGSGTTKYCIADKYGNKSYFDTYGRLTKQVNNQATTSNITVTYTTTSGNLISTITDGAGRVYSFTYSSNLLNRISFKGKGSTELSYVAFGYSSSNLSTVTDKDGKACTYTYDSNHLLTSGKDIDGYKLTYTYNTAQETWQPHRVASISESDSAAGGTLAIEYAHNQTTFTDHNGNIQIMQFNNLGNTVSIQDGEGRAEYAQYAISDSASTTENPKNNQLSLSSKLQNTVGNVLKDSSFENGVTWTNVSSSVSHSIASGTAYRGSKALKLTRSAAGSASGVYSGSFSVAASATYTFSAYVKTGSGATAYLALTDGSATVTSSTLAAGSEWTRLEVSYTNTATSAKTVTARLLTTTVGTVYMDCVQVEKSPTASRYNLIENGDFRHSGSPAYGWTGTGLATTDVRTTATAAAPELSTDVFSITGDRDTVKTLSQTVNVSGSAGETFVLAGWAKGDSAPLSEGRTFGLKATINYTDGNSDDFSVSFNPDADSSINWQYAAVPLVAKKAYSSIAVSITYSNNVNTAYFDGIQLYKEAFGSSYTYDDEGNVISVVDLQKQTTTYEYNANNDLTGVNLPTGAKLTYTYDNYHNVKTATTEEGVVYNFTYDAYGNNTGVSIGSGTSKISSTAAYTSDGNRVASTTDASGMVTQYSYNENTNVLEWVQYPEDTEATRTNYTYDSMYRLASAAATTDTGSALTASYTYTDDMLTKITTGSTTYTFAYGDFALRSSIKVGSKTLASYTYTSDQNKYLSKLAYGNGDSVQYTYDKYGRVTKQTYEDGSTVAYKYDNSGALATVTDSATGRTTTYYYDLTDRLMKYVESGNGYSHSVGYTYDDINNLTAQVETINGTAHTTSYAYDDDNRVTSVTNGNASATYSYDAYSRVIEKTSKNGRASLLTHEYDYLSLSATATTGQVSKHTVLGGDYYEVFTYSYDDNGNIVSVYVGGDSTSYVYDSANQLVRENNEVAGKTWIWEYDDAGNILNRKEYAYTTGTLGTVLDTVTYTYGDSSWGDLLTAYDGQTITHDGIGNPLTDGTWTYTWQNGRELATMSDGATTWTYTYDADGLRTKRTNGTTTYSYVYNGGSLSQMTVGSDTLYFVYDAGGSPMTVTYNGTVYYYVTNLQGDVIAILNSSGTTVVTYTYDAWGNILSTTGTMASTLGTTNPLRYRGYVYDEESGLYYLQSRYYNPEIGRFLNADIYAATGQGLLGSNMFAYCGNNPVNRTDFSGKDWWHWAAAAAIVVVAAAAVVVTAGGAAGAALAITAVANGVAVSSTATTVAAGVFVGSSVALASSAYTAMVDSNTAEEFAQYGEEALIATAAGGGFGGAVAYSLPGHNCFVEGTDILTEDGPKDIEKVRPGDYVWAWDEETGDVALKEVVETYVNETYELVHVFVDGEEIITTPSHPFYSPVKGWTDAVQLRAGDILVLVNGEYVVVEKIQHEILESPVTVYNFQVKDYHTYYVTDAGILVHNDCDRIGGGHGNPTHSNRIEEHMDTLEASGDYTTIYGNRSLNTAGQVGNQRPDVIAIGKNGTVEVWEFASPSQSAGTAGYTALADKIKTMQAANPSIIFHEIVPW